MVDLSAFPHIVWQVGHGWNCKKSSIRTSSGFCFQVVGLGFISSLRLLPKKFATSILSSSSAWMIASWIGRVDQSNTTSYCCSAFPPSSFCLEINVCFGADFRVFWCLIDMFLGFLDLDARRFLRTMTFLRCRKRDSKSQTSQALDMLHIVPQR